MKDSMRTGSGEEFLSAGLRREQRQERECINTSRLIPSLLSTLLQDPEVTDYQIPGITKKCSGICSIPEVFESVLMLL